jgi:hypothetical protein
LITSNCQVVLSLAISWTSGSSIFTVSDSSMARWQASLQGYSKDGQGALFRFWFKPQEDHGAVGSYLLEKVNGRWEFMGKRLSYSS